MAIPGLIHTQQSSGCPAEESGDLVKAHVVCGSQLPSPEGHGVGGSEGRGVMGSAWLSQHLPKELEWTIRAEKASSVSEFAFNSTEK